MMLRLFAQALIALCSIVIPIHALAQTFTISIDPVVIPYDPATGIGSATTTLRIVQDIIGGIPIAQTAGFSFSYSHDSAIFQSVALEFGGPLLDLNGGSGPGLGSIDPFPDGGTAGAIFSIVGAETIAFGAPTAVATLTIATTPAAWIGNSGGGIGSFSPTNPAGVSPPIDDFMVIGATSFPLVWDFPTIQFVPIDMFFLRGDADGDGSVIAIGDAITILGGLFSGGTIACESAADTNGDGVLDLADPIYLLNYGFGGSAPPPAPFPACGFVNGTPLGCGQSGC